MCHSLCLQNPFGLRRSSFDEGTLPFGSTLHTTVGKAMSGMDPTLSGDCRSRSFDAPASAGGLERDPSAVQSAIDENTAGLGLSLELQSAMRQPVGSQPSAAAAVQHRQPQPLSAAEVRRSRNRRNCSRERYVRSRGRSRVRRPATDGTSSERARARASSRTCRQAWR